MKKKDKKFLKCCNEDLHNQLCFGFERKSAERLMKKGFIRKIKDDKSYFSDIKDEFFIWLTKKGLKRVKRLNNEKVN
jgi:hypothetical protein